jgi:hypothetical protein
MARKKLASVIKRLPVLRIQMVAVTKAYYYSEGAYAASKLSWQRLRYIVRASKNSSLAASLM